MLRIFPETTNCIYAILVILAIVSVYFTRQH